MSTPHQPDIESRVSVTACFREPTLRSATMSPSMSTVVQRWWSKRLVYVKKSLVDSSGKASGIVGYTPETEGSRSRSAP